MVPDYKPKISLKLELQQYSESIRENTTNISAKDSLGYCELK
jgi:hypothetical protein